MSAIDVDHANKSNIGGSVLNPSPIGENKPRAALSFSKSNDELNLSSKLKMQTKPKLMALKTSELIREDTRKDAEAIESIIIKSTDKMERGVLNNQYIDPEVYAKERETTKPNIIMATNVESDSH